ncbi:MAG: methyl-accepting chemotaxis protein [Marinovum sp.]|nr:methyl-accepting chemotaxis protein [Marinovum sp.]
MIKKENASKDERAVLAMVLGMVPIVGALAYVFNANILATMGISFGFAATSFGAARSSAALLKPLLGVALIGQCIALTASLSGQAWQIDSHMVFFAALAVLVLLRDIPTILMATVVIAVHHLSLAVLLPSVVYPSAALVENLGRTAFHAVAILVEAGFLCVAIARQNQLVSAVEYQMSENGKIAATERKKAAQREARHAERQAATEHLSAGLQSLANGDLTTRVVAEDSSELASLQNNFNASLEQLQSILQGVAITSQGIALGTGDLSNAAQELARRNEMQAASLAETSLSVAQIKGSVTDTAQSADRANDLVQKTQQLAENGKNIVADTVSAMEEIREGSDAISQILSAIDDIAFQTNLLALNAGVEAARAGSAGSGFAIVASEVRALAQRSSDAAQEIASLIENSQGKVKSGVELAQKANLALSEITEQVIYVSDAVSEINSNTKSQAININEINSAMASLDNLTQQNAAMAEETSAASVQLKSDAAELEDTTSSLKFAEMEAPFHQMAKAS